MQYKYIEYVVEGKVATVTLARSQKRNAFTPTMVNEIAHAIDRINGDSEVNLMVLKAQGPVFCAGMDLKAFSDPSQDVANPDIINRDISLGQVMRTLLKPSIAVLQGDVIAGAFLLVLGCSYVFASREVRFRLPELDIGIFPFQVMESLLRVMPEKKMLQLCLETDYFDVHRAIALGIVDGLLEEGALDKKVNDFQRADVNALTAGMRALVGLKDIESKDRYAYLKSCLEKLKKDSH